METRSGLSLPRHRGICACHTQHCWQLLCCSRLLYVVCQNPEPILALYTLLQLLTKHEHSTSNSTGEESCLVQMGGWWLGCGTLSTTTGSSLRAPVEGSQTEPTRMASLNYAQLLLNVIPVCCLTVALYPPRLCCSSVFTALAVLRTGGCSAQQTKRKPNSRKDSSTNAARRGCCWPAGRRARLHTDRRAGHRQGRWCSAPASIHWSLIKPDSQPASQPGSQPASQPLPAAAGQR
jgi:hypothetical protein